MESTIEVCAGVYPLRFTLIESFKCSSVSLVLYLDFMTFMSEKAASQRYVEQNQIKQTFSVLLGECSYSFLGLQGSRNVVSFAET